LAPHLEPLCCAGRWGGVVTVGARPGYTAGYKPGLPSLIQNLASFRLAYYSGNSNNTFTDYDGYTNQRTANFAAGINLERFAIT